MDVLAAAAAAAAPEPRDASPEEPAYRRLGDLERYSIVALHRDGRSNSYIARHLGVHKDTVRRWLDHFAQFGDVRSGSRSGRPRCTDEQCDTHIAVVARIDKFTSPRQIKRKLELDVSSRTIDRRLQEAGLFGRVARHKRDYTDAQAKKRLAFGQGYGDWTKRQWEKVLFSDEKCFYGKGFCGRMWVRREKGAALDPQYTVHKTAHPVKVNVWACFCANGQGYCHIFNENMDSVLMKKILNDNLVPSAQLHFSFDPPEQWYLLHDNDKKFSSHLVTNHLHTLGVSVIDFPAYSPDLNPIENLWATMARAVEQHQCETMEQLQDVIATEWDKLDKRLMKKLAHSMRKRCKAVVEAGGWHTKY